MNAKSSRTIEPLDLFEMVGAKRVFDDEFEAVVSGQKPMLLLSLPGSVLENPNPDDEEYSDYSGLLLDAARAGLLVVHDPEVFPIRGQPYLNIRLLIVRRDQAWRIPSLLALKHAFRERFWSDGAATLQSTLLGYTDDQITEYLARERHQYAGWGCETIFGLLDESQVRQLRPLGMRSMTEDVFGNVRWFQLRNLMVLRTNAHILCDDRVVARVGMRHELAMRMTKASRGNPDVSIAYLDQPGVDVGEWNEGLASRIEVWTADGWK